MTEENEFLTAAFKEKEIRDAVFQMKHNKASCPDGFLTEFCQFFWDVMKENLIDMFNDFHGGDLPMHSLIFGVITLLPKKEKQMPLPYYNIIQFVC